jgi:tetraacyldisaccharide 4'-kinase
VAARNSISPEPEVLLPDPPVWESWGARIWRPHPWLLPLTSLYRFGFRAHQAWLERERAALGAPPEPPLIVIGSLRAGGAGKTSVALALARELIRRGLRPALLAYRLGSRGRPAAGGWREVGPDSDWRESSEEAVLLRRESGARVFATRNRARAWRSLAGGEAGGPFDVFIADDGFQDPRLFGAFRVLLARPGEAPRRRDLLPAGPFREDASAAARADLVVAGPERADPEGPGPGNALPVGVTRMLPSGRAVGTDGPGYRRRLVLPAGWERSRPCLVHCSLGDPAPFLSDLESDGIRPLGIILGRNHGEPPLARLRAAVARFPGAPILCTRKDAVKLERSGLPWAAVDQEIELDAEVPDRIAALAGRNPYLVDYPRCRT